MLIYRLGSSCWCHPSVSSLPCTRFHCSAPGRSNSASHPHNPAHAFTCAAATAIRPDDISSPPTTSSCASHLCVPSYLHIYRREERDYIGTHTLLRWHRQHTAKLSPFIPVHTMKLPSMTTLIMAGQAVAGPIPEEARAVKTVKIMPFGASIVGTVGSTSLPGIQL
jgi:hypothetical protein